MLNGVKHETAYDMNVFSGSKDAVQTLIQLKNVLAQ